MSLESRRSEKYTVHEFRITSLREIHSTCIHVPEYLRVLFGNTKGCPPQTPELEAPPACTAELTVPQESTVQQLPFEWWHQRITSRLKSQNHLYNVQFTGKYCCD